MKNRNIVKTVGAFVLSGVMLIGTGIPAFAQTADDSGILQDGTENAPVELEITKDFQVPEGAEIPTVQFDFTADKITNDAPHATIRSVNYSDQDSKGTASNGKYTISKNASLTFDTAFPHAGVYKYLVVETAGAETGVVYDSKKYEIEVYVANKTAMDGQTYVKAIVSKDKDTQEKKPIKFVNAYTKDAQLVIEKRVTGELADLTKDFAFTIKIELPDGTTEAQGYIDHSAGTRQIIKVSEENNYEDEFMLRNGEVLKFDSLPVGTRYVVTEKGVDGDGYTPKVTVIENGVEGQVQQGNETDDLASSDDTNLVGDNTNKVTFVNEYEEVSITGIIENNLPFILMIGIAGVGLGALAVTKKRKTAK